MFIEFIKEFCYNMGIYMVRNAKPSAGVGGGARAMGERWEECA